MSPSLSMSPGTTSRGGSEPRQYGWRVAVVKSPVARIFPVSSKVAGSSGTVGPWMMWTPARMSGAPSPLKSATIARPCESSSELPTGCDAFGGGASPSFPPPSLNSVVAVWSVLPKTASTSPSPSTSTSSTVCDDWASPTSTAASVANLDGSAMAAAEP